jgi:hypothetical protein
MVGYATYTKVIMLHSKTLKISTAENYGSKVVVDGFEERLCGGKSQVGT